MLRILFLSAMCGAMLNADSVIGDLGDGPVLHSAGWPKVGQTFTVPATDNVLSTWEFNIAPRNSDGGLISLPDAPLSSTRCHERTITETG